MDYKLVTRGFSATDAVKDYVEKKVSKLEKVMPEGDHVHTEVKIERENKDFKAELTTHIRGAVVRTDEMTNDMYASLDMAVDAMEKKLEKYKNKRIARHRASSRVLSEVMKQREEESEDEEFEDIVKTKRFFLRP